MHGTVAYFLMYTILGKFQHYTVLQVRTQQLGNMAMQSRYQTMELTMTMPSEWVLMETAALGTYLFVSMVPPSPCGTNLVLRT